MIFIPTNTPSSKNSRIWTGRVSIVSKATTKWRADTKQYWLDLKPIFKELIKDKELPLEIGFHFVRKSKHHYDFINPLQTIQDEMQHYGWITNDDMSTLVPFPFKINNAYTTYDKNNPGVYIKVLN